MKELSVRIEGLSKNISHRVIISLKEIFKEFSFLDLRRLNNIIITSSFNKEIASYKTNNRKKGVDNSTKAVVITVPKNGNFKLLLVVRADFIVDIIKSKQSKDYKRAFHIIHHELSHVHDNNKKIDMFKDKMNNSTYKGLDSIFYPIAEVCWSEYIANFLSVKSAVETDYIFYSSQSLLFIVKELEDIQNESVIFDSLNQIDTFFKRASYLIGYLNGLSISLEQLNEKVSLELDKSFCSEFFKILIYELNTIHSVYPYGFINPSIYKGIADLVKNFYEEVGIYVYEENGFLKIFMK